jgi:hypothetical protein
MEAEGVIGRNIGAVSSAWSGKDMMESISIVDIFIVD